MRGQRKGRRIKIDTSMVKHFAAIAIGTIMTTTMITCKSTQSYFTSTALAEGNTSAASPQDIITCKLERLADPYNMITEDVPIDLSSPDSVEIVNPDKIKIYNKTGNYMIIYFALDDTTSKYLRPINPIEGFKEMTEAYGNTQVKVSEGEVPIDVDIDIEQFLSLLKDQENKKSKQDNGEEVNEKDDFITGEIRIKYLNNYINKTQKISFSKSYLMMQFLKGIQDDLNSKLAPAESEKSSDAGSPSTDDTNIELTPEEELVINYISPELLPKMNQLVEDKKPLEQTAEILQQKINDLMSKQAASAAATGSTAPIAPASPTSSIPASSPTVTDSYPTGSTVAGSAAPGNIETGSTASNDTTSESSSSISSTSSSSDSGITKSDSSPEGAASGNSSSDASASGSTTSESPASSSTMSDNSKSSDLHLTTPASSSTDF